MTILKFAKKIFPLNRSLTGDGVRKTLKIIKKKVPSLKVFEVKSGEKIFDWEVPLEWNVNNAYILDPKGKKIVDFKSNNLHLVGYSQPVNKTIKLEKLKKKLFTIKKIPSAIPYITSYYKKDWGFCMTYNQFRKLKKGSYKVFIDSSFKKGSLSYGQILIKGKKNKEVLLSTNICHPSMANNETSGLTLATFLAKWISKQKFLNSYRIVFVPETIGALCFLKKNFYTLRKNVIGGFTISCVGDEKKFSYLPSRKGNTISDKIAKYVLGRREKNFKKFSWLDRGSDERQYCAPFVDLPIASMMRSKYDEYKEYHTSLDKIGSVVTEKGLIGSLNLYKDAIKIFENKDAIKIFKQNFKPISLKLGEPFLKKYGLYKTKNYTPESKIILDSLSYCDGKHDIIDIANLCNISFFDMVKVMNILKKHKLIRRKND